MRRSFERARVYLAIQADGNVTILGYYQPGTRRSAKLEQAIATALGHESSATATT